VNSVREPDAVAPHVRFDEKGAETLRGDDVAAAWKPSTEVDRAELSFSPTRGRAALLLYERREKARVLQWGKIPPEELSGRLGSYGGTGGR
jgi:hypothetical protein